MLSRPAVRAAAADFEMVRADGGRGDGQDQHDRQYDQRQEESAATVGSALGEGDRRKEEKEERGMKVDPGIKLNCHCFDSLLQ